MKCICGADAPDIEHGFCAGDPQNPTSTWIIIAPLYFKADKDNRAAVEGYCSPTCAMKGMSNAERSG